MQRQIKDIANIISGYTFREAIKSQSEGGAFVLQAKNINPAKDITNNENLIEIKFERAESAFFLQNDDIVVVSRGAKAGSFRAAVFKNKSSNIVAASSVFIIRIIDKMVLPAYVSIFLNSNVGQKRIMETESGSIIKAIRRTEFEKIEIPVPTVKQQDIIVKLAANLNRQRAIFERKMQIEENIANVIFEKI